MYVELTPDAAAAHAIRNIEKACKHPNFTCEPNSFAGAFFFTLESRRWPCNPIKRVLVDHLSLRDSYLLVDQKHC